MEKEGYRATRRYMIVGFGGPIENGQYGVYSFRKSFGRVRVAEKDIGASVIQVERREAKFWRWKFWYWMGTRLQSFTPITALLLLFGSRCLLLGVEGKRGGSVNWISRSGGHCEGCW